jgi:AcrR family transcriptional regulator
VAGFAVVTTAADASAPSPSALRLVLAAERLFATHGIDGVSLRQITAEAGSGNNSAVHYHFGSKHGLIAAIFRHRLPQIISERRLLAARCDPDDLRSRCEAHFLPVLSMAEATDNHYVSFVEQIQRMDLAAAGDLLDLPAEGIRSNEEFRRDLHHLLGHLDEPLRQHRINEGQALCMHAAADRERAVASSADVVPFELFANAFFDAMAGFLTAPASETTMRRLRDAGDVGAARLRLL